MMLKVLYAFQKEKGRNMKHCCHGDGRLSVFDLTVMKFWSTGIPIDCSCSYLKQAWESNCSAKYAFTDARCLTDGPERGKYTPPWPLECGGLLFTCTCVLCGVEIIYKREEPRGSPTV